MDQKHISRKRAETYVDLQTKKQKKQERKKQKQRNKKKQRNNKNNLP